MGTSIMKEEIDFENISWYILGKVMKYGGFRLGLFKPWIIKIKGLGKFELLLIRQLIKKSGAPNDNFRKLSVRKTIWDLEFSDHFL